jgi:hypothetical protein
MRTRSLVISATSIVALLLGLAAIAFAADPFIGTWKLDVAKCKSSDPSLINKSETLQNLSQGNSIKTIFDGVDSQGKPFHIEGVGKWDGKEYLQAGDPNADRVAITKVDANIVEVVAKKAGKIMSTYRTTVSKDGKTMTIEGKGKDAKGQEWNYTFILDKL